MKKCLLLVTCFCMLLMICGHSLLFTLKRAEIRAEVRKDIATQPDGLLKMHFTAEETNNLAWEDDTEFHYQGKMYDVVKKEVRGTLVTIFCISDEKESLLVDSYLNAERNSSRHSPSAVLLKLLSQQYVAVHMFETIPLMVDLESIYPCYQPLVYFVERPVVSPPPKLC